LLGFSLAVGLLRPGYEPLRDAISELGEIGAPNALLWNVAGFGVVAVLYGAYAIAVGRWFGAGLLFGLTVLQAFAIGASASFNCDPGCPAVPASASMLGHMLSGLVYFAITCVLPLVGWRTFRGRSEWARYARPSLVVGIVLLALFVIGPALGQDGVGTWQRTVLIVAYAWQTAVALRLRGLLQRADSDAMEGPEALANSSVDAPSRVT
jgi:hypothetical membrane protein